MALNPFHPSKVAIGSLFLARVSEQAAILERIQTNGSTAVIGNPHIGKSSLLARVADQNILKKYGVDPSSTATILLSLELFPSESGPVDFWNRIIDRATRAQPEWKDLFNFNRAATDPSFYLNLNDAFDELSLRGGKIVLFIDEFDKFLGLPKFCSGDFINSLKAISEKGLSLCLVTTSRLSIRELQSRVLKISPNLPEDPFNFLNPLFLKGFDDAAIDAWLGNYLSAPAQVEVRLLGGHHPQLLHTAGSLLWEESSVPNPTWTTRRVEFINRCDAHFHDVWNYLDSRAQWALFLFTMKNLEGTINKKLFDIEDVDTRLTWLSGEINDLIQMAILGEDQDENPKIDSLGFYLWLVERKISPAFGTEEDFSKWLIDKEFKLGGLVTQEEIKFMEKIINAIPANVVDLARKALLPKWLQ